jgi:4-phospho-D-threonate 3-dehydrogenase / 4-phospho-D-erythronate 3-dehydrogenase
MKPALKKLILAVTPGDPEGVGPEIVWETIRRQSYQFKKATLLCVGAKEPFRRMGARIIDADPATLTPPKEPRPHVWLLPAPTRSENFLPGFQSGWAIEAATALIKKGRAQALVTGPISKERLQRGGYHYCGHTDFLASLCGTKEVTMMLANKSLRISLVTTHIALKDVPKSLTQQTIKRCILHTADHLRGWWGIRHPRIAVAALNPHAGESGLFGKEEIQLIAPTLEDLRTRGEFDLLGPLPADTLFAKHILSPKKERFDAVVCMYHDQGLIPVKLLDFPRTVNVTLGLPIVRTSVDHGTGFDIAGKGVADPSSLQSAIQMAIDISEKRKG